MVNEYFEIISFINNKDAIWHQADNFIRSGVDLQTELPGEIRETRRHVCQLSRTQYEEGTVDSDGNRIPSSS